MRASLTHSTQQPTRESTLTRQHTTPAIWSRRTLPVRQYTAIILRLLYTIAMSYKPVLSIAQQLAPRNAPLRVIKSSSLYVSQPNPSWFGNPPDKPDGAWSCKHWLTSRFHFSFAEYAGGPGNFGVLRVVNDDIVLSLIHI